MAGNFGPTATPTIKPAVEVPKTAAPPTSGAGGGASGGTGGTTVMAPVIRATGNFRFVKPDGSTVIAQAALAVGGSALAVINIDGAAAIAQGNGRCAFNVKYDEIANAAAAGTTNRLYSNDTLVAQNTKIELAANVVKSIWTQPYLFAGANNVKVVVNAEGAAPSIGWVRVNVFGKCGGVTTPTSDGTPPASPPAASVPGAEAPKPPVTAPVTPPTTAPVTPPVTAPVTFGPGSGDWNNLVTAMGYSNYGVTQLKGKGYARYDELAKLNVELVAAVAAGKIERSAYNALIVRWNSFVNDKAFREAMAAIVPPPAGQK